MWYYSRVHYYLNECTIVQNPRTVACSCLNTCSGLNTCSAPDAHIEVLATNCYEHMQNLHYVGKEFEYR